MKTTRLPLLYTSSLSLFTFYHSSNSKYRNQNIIQFSGFTEASNTDFENQALNIDIVAINGLASFSFAFKNTRLRFTKVSIYFAHFHPYTTTVRLVIGCLLLFRVQGDILPCRLLFCGLVILMFFRPLFVSNKALDCFFI